jgi:glycine/D-amino acid oxidase-like deaminating enzyme
VLYVTQDPQEMAKWERWMEHARSYQLHSRLLSAAEAQAMTPGCDTKWLGGLHTPSDGRAEPSMAGPAIATAARKLGATIHQSCAARGLETEAGAVSGVVTEHGTIRTRKALCAGGAWSSLFCRRHGVDLPQLTVRASVLRTEAAPEVFDSALGTPSFGLRRRLDGGFTVGYHAGCLPLYPKVLAGLPVREPAHQAGVRLGLLEGADDAAQLAARQALAVRGRAGARPRAGRQAA